MGSKKENLKMQDEKYMERALKLAQKGLGLTSPNPMVGAVIVKDGKIIGEGYHEKYGGLHAERNALKDCYEKNNSSAGATMYVTLEPCCHHGKTPPCTEAIIAAKIARVVVASNDPNPLVAGKGLKILEEAGIEVVTGVLKKECDDLNKIFFHHIQTKRPFVAMKYAMTMDGKIASYTGASKWITDETARWHVHHLRQQYGAIMVGIGTVLADDPMLNVRTDDILSVKNPVRIICDTGLRIPLESKIVKSSKEIKTIIAYCYDGGQRENTCEQELEKGLSDKEKCLTEAGCHLLKVGRKEGHVDLQEVIRCITDLNIDSLLIEGGGTLNYQALSQGRLRLCLYCS